MAEFPNNPFAFCSATVQVRTLAGTVEYPIDDLAELIEENTPDQTWTEIGEERQTQLIDLGGGVQATRITSFTMSTPSGSRIRFEFAAI